MNNHMSINSAFNDANSKNFFLIFISILINVGKYLICVKINRKINNFSRFLFCKLKLLRLNGGGKKRKKKNYTKPKKIKHVRKKTKLRYLLYYSFTGNEFQKLRKISPSSPGCFMAEHIDRLTCGKSGLTYVRK